MNKILEVPLKKRVKVDFKYKTDLLTHFYNLFGKREIGVTEMIKLRWII